MSSNKSSSSHKRRRRSQHDVREAYGAPATKETSIPSSVGGTTNGNPSIAEIEPGASSISQPPLDPPSNDPRDDDASNYLQYPDVPDPMDSSDEEDEEKDEYQTPNNRAFPTIAQQQDNINNSSEPSTFLASVAASDLSTSLPSTSDRSSKPPPPPPPQNTSFSAAFPLANVASPSNHLPATSRPPSNTTTLPPSSTNTRVSSLNFNVWHRQYSLGSLQYGTQSSPQKSLNLLPAIEGQANATTSVANPTTNPPSRSPSASVPTMVPTQPSVPEDTTQDPVAAAPLGLTRAVGTHKPPPLNLKTLLPDVGPGSFLIKLRRLDPFYCKNPGPSSL